MNDTTIFTIYWLTAPIVLGGLALLGVGLFVRWDKRRQAAEKETGVPHGR